MAQHPCHVSAGQHHLRIVGPFFGCYGFGSGLYFAAQGAGKLLWPLFAGFLRLVIAAIGGWAALLLTASENWLFAALALGLLTYGVGIGATTIGTYAVKPDTLVHHL